MILDFKNIKSTLNNFFQIRQDVRFVTVFGSYATGKAKQDSDIDIAICGNRKFSPDELVDMSTQLSMLLGLEVDLIDLSKSHGAILEEAMMKGEKILQRSPADFEHLLKKMWYDKEDDGRFRQRTHQIRLAQWTK